MKSKLLLLFLSFSITCIAQPTFIGTMLVDGNYNTFNLTDQGAFRQVRLQATSNAATDSRIWEFATGNYFENWRPYTFPTTTSFNQIIDPAVNTASARYNSGFGGASSFLPAITSGNYYTLNITEFGPPTDQFMAFLETTFNPVTINSVSASPSGDPFENMPVTITAMASAAPAAGERVFIRYSTDNFVTSNLVELVFAGMMGTGQIPGLAEGTMVDYYIYSSNFTAASISTDVTNFGELAHDMSTLNFNNNGGTNYSYTVQAALPVELVSFDGKAQERNIELFWETASEIDNSHFMIEKSTDAKTWSSIGRVEGFGKANFSNTYNFIDEKPIAGYNYYRLKQVDYDNSFSHSPTISIFWENNSSISLFPNPAKDQIFIKHFNADLRNVSVEIFDTNGRQVLQEQWNGAAINLKTLDAGLYMVRILHQGEIHQQRIVVQ